MRLSLRRLALSLLLICGSSDVYAQNSASDGTSLESFHLRPGDFVRLAVKDEPGFNGEYPVLTDGTVLLPVVGVVQVAGVRFGVVEQQVREAFARELADPVLALMPMVRVAVLGEVRVPGLYLMDGSYDVTEALSRAGGLTPLGSIEAITLVRNGVGEELKDDPSLLKRLRPGDRIVVGRRNWFALNAPVLVGAGTSMLAAAITAILVR